MLLETEQIGLREKLVLCGLYLSKFDTIGLKILGFDSFIEAFNVLGYSLGSKPASVKNYRDEFDPLFPNARKGWHKRSTRKYCLEVFERFNALDLETFAGLLKSFVTGGRSYPSFIDSEEKTDAEDSSFARRLITGLAAEQYFETMQPSLPEFKDFRLENTTRLGCGYDFRLTSGKKSEFTAVEVKGIAGHRGLLSLTPKEHEVAKILNERYFLFVVRNFNEEPCHDIYKSPLTCGLRFKKQERVIVQISWSVSV